MSRRFPAWLTIIVGLAALGAPGQAGASYCGGASYRVAPTAAVVAQCQVVTLAPQCTTLMQTSYETVYERVPYTVMQTQYRTGFKSEPVTVMIAALNS